MSYAVSWCEIFRRLEKEKGRHNVHYELALYRLRQFSLAGRKIRSDIISMYISVHLLLDFPWSAVYVAPNRSGLCFHTFKIHQQRYNTHLCQQT